MGRRSPGDLTLIGTITAILTSIPAPIPMNIPTSIPAPMSILRGNPAIMITQAITITQAIAITDTNIPGSIFTVPGGISGA
jgi:hypothetical protein